MKLSNINEWVTFSANVGMLAGIIFLVVEIRQTNTLMEEEALASRMNMAMEIELVPVRNPELMELFFKSDLTPVDLAKINSFYRAIFTVQAWTFRSLDKSNLPLGRWGATAGNQFARTVWEETKDEFDSDYSRFMDEMFYDAYK